MRRSVLSVAIAGCTLAISGPGFSQINTSGIAPTQRATFNLAQAYPATSGGYTGTSPVLIAPNGCWNPNGLDIPVNNPTVQAPTLETRCDFTLNPSLNQVGPLGRTGFAVGGILCLPTAGTTDMPRLNVNAFVVPPTGAVPGTCFVQMVRLIKEIPGSIKCPDVYGLPVFDAFGNPTGEPARRYAQFGATPTGIRTWWALSYTMPGTKFHLELTVVCQRELPGGGRAPSIHVDRYTWQVVANADTLPVLINLLHTNTIGTMEIPCIVSEQAYCDFMAAAGLIKQADLSGSLEQRFNAIQTFEGLIGQYCIFVDFVQPNLLFPAQGQGQGQFPGQVGGFQPPSDLGTIPGGFGSVGVIDSLENPCCCKMLVDVERIAKDWGIQI